MNHNITTVSIAFYLPIGLFIKINLMSNGGGEDDYSCKKRNNEYKNRYIFSGFTFYLFIIRKLPRRQFFSSLFHCLVIFLAAF